MSLIFSLGTKGRAQSEVSSVALKENSLFMRGNNGSTVILIHGLTGTPNEMAILGTFLNKEGFSVVCPRLANHGEPIQIVKKTKWMEFYGSVREAFLKVERSADTKNIFVSGLCMGALLGLLLAIEFKDRIDGVSCLAPTFFYDGWNMPWYRHLILIPYYTPLKHFLYYREEPPYGIKNEAIRKHVHDYYSKADLDDLKEVAKYGYPYLPLALLYEHSLLARYIKKRLPEITTPIQIIQAKDDDTTSVKNSELVYNNVGSKVKEMVLLYNSYHLITVDQERGTVAEKMGDFFTRLTARETVGSRA